MLTGRAETSSKTGEMMSKEKAGFKAYITKYALTNGIEVIEVPDGADTNDGYLSFTEYEPWRNHFYSSKEWHRTEADAVIRAKKMQADKLKSIDKQRIRIADLRFEK